MRQAELWGSHDAWCNRVDVETWLQEHGYAVNWKLVIAKARSLIKKGRMEGCPCGCRGDFDLRGKPDDPWAEYGGD